MTSALFALGIVASLIFGAVMAAVAVVRMLAGQTILAMAAMTGFVVAGSLAFNLVLEARDATRRR